MTVAGRAFLDDVIAQLEAVPISPHHSNVSPFSGQGWDLPHYSRSPGRIARSESVAQLESILPLLRRWRCRSCRTRVYRSRSGGRLDVAIVIEDGRAVGLPNRWQAVKMGPWITNPGHVVGVAGQPGIASGDPRPTLYLPAAQISYRDDVSYVLPRLLNDHVCGT